MENTNRYEGGIGFGVDTGETQTPEYRTVRRPKFSSNPGRESDIYKDRKEEYIRDIEKKYGFTENRWKFLIGKYFDFNKDLIDPNQEGLDREVLEEIFNEYGANTSLDINSRLDSMFSSEQKESVITEELGSPQVAEDSEVKNTDLQSIELSPEQQAEIEARKANYQYPTRIARDGDYVRGMTLPEWLQIEEGSSEHTTLINGIKTNGIMPSLGKLGSNIKDQKANNDISGEYLAFINATREFYGLAPYVSEPEELVLENQTVNQLEFDLDGQQEPTPVVETESGTTPPVEDVRSTGEEVAPTQEISEVQATDSENGGENLPGPDKLQEALNALVEKITTQESSSVDKNSGALQQELDRLIAVEAKKLQRDQNTENISYKIDQEKLENFKENARKNISDYQKFASEHSSPVDKSNPKIQERYQLLEKQAWNSLYNLAHLLDGEIATLPQDRDIQLSHPEGVDIRQYLETRGYRFDENGDITHINDNGFEIELNRAIKTDSLIKSRRPSHIVYDKSIYLDNDMNYQGYLVRGLNQQTPDFIVGVLDKNNLEPIIVYETGQSTVPTTEAKQDQDPWSTESRGDTEFKKIFAGNLSKNRDVQGNNEIPDPWVKKATAINPEATKQAKTNEPPIIPVFPITSGDNSDLQSEGVYTLGKEGLETAPQVSINDLRLAYAKAEEAWNRKRGDLELENAFESAREDYNTELEKVLKLQIAEGQETNIHQIFKDEVLALRDRRIEQSQELQGKWEKRLNPIKEKFVNFVIKHKKIISRLNLAAGVAGGALALTGVGIPLAGGLAVARRMVSATLLGVSTGEGIRSLGEDADINSFWGKIKFKAVIPKLVQESLASSEDEFKQVSEDVLKERLGTLEAYYRLNGGVFTNDNQRQAYEKVLTELARRVQENVIYVENHKDKLQSDWQEQEPEELTEGEILEKAHKRWDERNPVSRNMRHFLDKDIQTERDLQKQAKEDWEKANPDRYASELLNTISDTRIVELDKFRRKRKIATGAGIAVGLLAGGAVHLSDEFNKPDTQGSGAGPGSSGGAGVPEAGAGVTKPIPDASPAGTGAEATEALRQQAADAANEAREVLAQDVSNLDSGETIWSQASKWLGPDASQAQIQQAVENYLQSQSGQESIFNLAQHTEGGRELLSQWGIDNAGEMASLSKEQLYEVSKYLGEGKLDGLTELSLDNLDALEQAVAPAVTGAPIAPPSPLEAPVTPSEFTKDLSEILGKQNLTDIQAKEIVQSYFADDYGREAIYNSIIKTDEGATFLSNGFGVDTLADFANITPDQMYEITNSIDSNELRKILNQTILARFEDAPDMVELTRGTNSLNVVQRYIANELGNLPYDSNLGKQVLDTYVQTDAGKQWLYDAIVNNPDINNQNIQYFKEYLRFKGITSPEEFVSKFNWAEFSGNRNIPTSAFWNQIRLPNGGARLQPLSTLLQPSKMPGIKDAVRQVLTRQ